MHSAPARPVEHAPRGRADAGPSAPPRVQQWKNALLDLSLRNRLINYTDARRAGARPCPGRALGILENFVHDGTPITLLPGDQLAAVARRSAGCHRAASCPQEQLTELLVERRAVHADVGDRTATSPRLRDLAYKAKTVHRGDRREQPLPGAGQPGVGARRPPAALAAGARPGRRSPPLAAAAPTG